MTPVSRISTAGDFHPDRKSSEGWPVRLALIAGFGVFLTFLPLQARADEAGFLKSLAGTWSGKGTATTRIGSSPLTVSCKFTTSTPGVSLSMKGSCRGLVVVRRTISADIKATGARYSGTYLGPSGRPSTLSGGRKGNVINLAIRWSREINGDRSAQLTIEKIGDKGLRLRITDRDPKTGKNVVTSDIRLTR